MTKEKTLAQLMREHNDAVMRANLPKGDEFDKKWRKTHGKGNENARFIFRMRKLR